MKNQANPKNHKLTRRDFVKSSAAAGAAVALAEPAGQTKAPAALIGGSRPVVIASANGLRATAKAMEMVKKGEAATKEQAIQKMITEKPELYEQYLNE